MSIAYGHVQALLALFLSLRNVHIHDKYNLGGAVSLIQTHYEYTAIATATGWRYLRVFDEQTTYHSIISLEDVITRFPHPITGVKTDNGSIFTNYYLGTNKRSD